MALAKNDLKQIETVVSKVVTKEIDDLAILTVKEFDRVNNKLAQHDKEFEKLHKEILAHDFKMTEMVHRADHYKLEERVVSLETQKLKSA